MKILPLVAAGNGLANLSMYSASYFSGKRGMLDLYQFIKPVNLQAASDWKGLFGNIRKSFFVY